LGWPIRPRLMCDVEESGAINTLPHQRKRPQEFSEGFEYRAISTRYAHTSSPAAPFRRTQPGCVHLLATTQLCPASLAKCVLCAKPYRRSPRTEWVAAVPPETSRL